MNVPEIKGFVTVRDLSFDGTVHYITNELLSRYCLTLQRNYVRLSVESLRRYEKLCLTCRTEQHIVQMSAVNKRKSEPVKHICVTES